MQWKGLWDCKPSLSVAFFSEKGGTERVDEKAIHFFLLLARRKRDACATRRAVGVVFVLAVDNIVWCFLVFEADT